MLFSCSQEVPLAKKCAPFCVTNIVNVDFHTLINTPNRWILLDQLYLIPLDPQKPMETMKGFFNPQYMRKRTLKMKVVGSPWHRLIVIDIINDIHVQTLILLVSPSSHPSLLLISKLHVLPNPSWSKLRCCVDSKELVLPQKTRDNFHRFFPRPVEKYGKIQRPTLGYTSHVYTWTKHLLTPRIFWKQTIGPSVEASRSSVWWRILCWWTVYIWVSDESYSSPKGHHQVGAFPLSFISVW